MKRSPDEIRRLIRAVEQLRRRDELVLAAERKRAADALATIGRVYEAAGEDIRQAAIRSALYRDHLVALSGRRVATEERAAGLAQSLALADGRLRTLDRALGHAEGREERRQGERDLAERLALAPFPVPGKPRDAH